MPTLPPEPPLVLDDPLLAGEFRQLDAEQARQHDVNLVIQKSPKAAKMVVHIDKVKKCYSDTPTPWIDPQGGGEAISGDADLITREDPVAEILGDNSNSLPDNSIPPGEGQDGLVSEFRRGHPRTISRPLRIRRCLVGHCSDCAIAEKMEKSYKVFFDAKELQYRCATCPWPQTEFFSTGSAMRAHYRRAHDLVLFNLPEEPTARNLLAAQTRPVGERPSGGSSAAGQSGSTSAGRGKRPASASPAAARQPEKFRGKDSPATCTAHTSRQHHARLSSSSRLLAPPKTVPVARPASSTAPRLVVPPTVARQPCAAKRREGFGEGRKSATSGTAAGDGGAIGSATPTVPALKSAAEGVVGDVGGAGDISLDDPCIVLETEDDLGVEPGREQAREMGKRAAVALGELVALRGRVETTAGDLPAPVTSTSSLVTAEAVVTTATTSVAVSNLLPPRATRPVYGPAAGGGAERCRVAAGASSGGEVIGRDVFARGVTATSTPDVSLSLDGSARRSRSTSQRRGERASSAQLQHAQTLVLGVLSTLPMPWTFDETFAVACRRWPAVEAELLREALWNVLMILREGFEAVLRTTGAPGSMPATQALESLRYVK